MGVAVTTSKGAGVAYSARVVHLTRKDTVSCKPGYTECRAIGMVVA